MERTTEEVKKGLEDAHKSCYLAIELGDPLGYPQAVYVSYEATGNAINLIQQLEEDKARMECTITQLSGTIRHFREAEARVPRWISVEERLPEDVVDVLLFVRFGPECKIQFGWHIEDEWHDYDGNIYGEVTHWMPRPVPPEK